MIIMDMKNYEQRPLIVNSEFIEAIEYYDYYERVYDGKDDNNNTKYKTVRRNGIKFSMNKSDNNVYTYKCEYADFIKFIDVYETAVENDEKLLRYNY
jgi:hypothetical protein